MKRWSLEVTWASRASAGLGCARPLEQVPDESRCCARHRQLQEEGQIHGGPLSLLLTPRPKWRLRQQKGKEEKKRKNEKKGRHRKVVIGNCFWQLFVQHQNHFLCQHSEPYWKTGQVSLMSNLFQSSLVWAWQFTERLEELVITSVTGQLMHITLRHSRRWLSAPQ